MELDFFGTATAPASESDDEEDEENEDEQDEAKQRQSDDEEEEEREDNEDDDDDDADADDSKAPDSSTPSSTATLCRLHGLHLHGSDLPALCESFQQMKEKYGVPEYIIHNLTTARPDGCGYSAPTPIQMCSIPLLLKGRELIACAPTGSGKTVAYVVPILTALVKPAKEGYRAIVLCPTAELATQIKEQFHILSSPHEDAAQPVRWRIQVLTKAVANSDTQQTKAGKGKRNDILITTPGRLIHMMKGENIDLSSVEYLILDEADRLFELGFLEQIDEIFTGLTNPKLKRAFFSATMPQSIELLADSVLRDKVRVNVGARNAAQLLVSQSLKFVGSEEGKLHAMRQMIQEGLITPMLIFVQSINRAQQLYNELVYDNVRVEAMHSERTAAQRAAIIEKFRVGEIWVLICTDLMARGIDFKGVNCVINYDFPQSTLSYIHRIGRTGRAGKRGTAITFFTEQDKPMVRAVATVMKHAGNEVPDWIFGLSKMGAGRAKRLAQEAPARKPISEETARQMKQQKEERFKRKTEKLERLEKKKKKMEAAEAEKAASAKKAKHGHDEQKSLKKAPGSLVKLNKPAATPTHGHAKSHSPAHKSSSSKPSSSSKSPAPASIPSSTPSRPSLSSITFGTPKQAQQQRAAIMSNKEKTQKSEKKSEKRMKLAH